MTGAAEAMKIYLGQTVYKNFIFRRYFIGGGEILKTKEYVIAQELLKNGLHLCQLFWFSVPDVIFLQAPEFSG